MWDRDNKNTGRAFVTALPKRRARCALLLPGQDLLCFKQLWERKIITPKTLVIAVESDSKTAAVINKKMDFYRALGCRILVLNKNLWQLDLASHLPRNTVIDFCYLDTCSALTVEAMKWLFVTRTLFARNSTIVLNFCAITRNAGLKKLLAKLGTKLLTRATRDRLVKLMAYVGGPTVAVDGVPIRKCVFSSGMSITAALEDLVGRKLSTFFFYKDASAFMLTCCF